MDFKVTSSGKKLFSLEAKRKILAELDKGKSPADISREYGVPIRYFQAWRESFARGGTTGLSTGEEVVPVSEYKKLNEQIKQLQRALGKMTLERDVLKDAVDIATKKKWI